MTSDSINQPQTASGTHEPLEFGPWSFDPSLGDLTDGKATTRLEPQVAKLLAYFLRKQHQVISRDELITAVWENRIVSDDAINRCVSILRQTLSPDDKNAYIETVVRKGYLAHFPPPLQQEPSQTSMPGHRKTLFQVLLLATALTLLGIYLFVGGGENPTPVAVDPARIGPPMVAVLPFVASSQKGDGEFFANGVHNDLLTQLAKLQSMRVISATSVQEYAGTQQNIREVGNALGADVILEGNVQIAAEHIRINAQLIDARNDEHLWAESYNRELNPQNIFDVQSDIARSIAEAMDATLTAQDSQQLALIPTRNMAAYRAYHQALQLLELPGIVPSTPEYIRAMEEAVALDPNFSRAWAALVSALSFANFSGDQPEMTTRAEQALDHLQAIAPGSADLMIGQAAYVYYALKDYDHAHEIISRALGMNPSDVDAWELRSWIERRQGDFDAWLTSRREALRLDPRDPLLADSVLSAQFLMHQYDELEAELEGVSRSSHIVGYIRSLLQFREHRDFERLQTTMEDLCLRLEEPVCAWEAQSANRDYAAALQGLPASDLAVHFRGILQIAQFRILTLWLMGEKDALMQELPQWQAQLQSSLESLDDLALDKAYIDSALSLGVQGKNTEAEQKIQDWLLLKPFDWANRISLRAYACRVLGMIAAPQAAVQCIRDGLQEPSLITPFFEPYLPFYDSIRNEPEFIAMLAEIDSPTTAVAAALGSE